MSQATLSLGYRAIQRKVYSLHVIRINWKAFYFLAFAATFTMLFFYIYMVNQLTQGAYLIKNYNKDISSLLKENKVLEASFAESGFLQDARDKAKELSFEKTTNVKYIQILQNSLAEAPKNYQK